MAEPQNLYRKTLVPSRAIRRVPHLKSFLPDCASLTDKDSGAVDSVAGWGFKPTAQKARALAARRGLPYLAIEDGFFRSIGLGESGAPPIGLVMDDVGIYYDARTPSALERLLASDGWNSPELIARSEALIERIVRTGLSKTNMDPPLAEGMRPATGRRRILVVDQTRDDASIVGGMADDGSFARMLEAAFRDEPEAEIVVRLHPAVSAGLKRGYFDRRGIEGATFLDRPARAADVLARVDAVYTVSSQMGFEALLRGLPVRCFGAPFYAGWQATSDELPIPRRGRSRTVAEIFVAACMLYTRYVDPLTGEPCDMETAIDRLLLFRERSDAGAGLTAGIGFRPWKRAATKRLLASPRGETRFYNSVGKADAAVQAEGKGRIVVWGGKETPAITEALAASTSPTARMEDGFIRSVGLGSDFHLPGSVVLDDVGIYYDARGPSRLERILEAGGFDAEMLERAERLRRTLVASGVTKYNVGGVSGWEKPKDRESILVVGQVEDDKSIRFGCEGIDTNLGLLEAVRRDFPDGYIIYKPHPDVLAGNRAGSVSEARALEVADRVVVDVDIAACLANVDRLATLTSLAGFEALLRGVAVSTYGRPFYAGWGLTDDRLGFERRTRRLSLGELVAGTLIAYPIYADPRSGLPCPPEHLVALLAEARGQKAGKRRMRWLRYVLQSLKPSAPTLY